MGIRKFRYAGWAALAQGAALLQFAGCLPTDFPQVATQTLISNRIVDVFAFFLDQVFFRMGL